MKPLLLPYIFNIVVLIPVGLTPFGGRGGQAVGLPGQVTGGCRDSHDLGLFLDADRDWLGDRAVPPGLDVAGPVDPGHLQLTLAQRLRRAPSDSRSWWRSELGNRWDVPFHRPVLSLGDPLGENIQHRLGAILIASSPMNTNMIRLGLCCIFRDQPIKFTNTTATAVGRMNRSDTLAKLGRLCMTNPQTSELTNRERDVTIARETDIFLEVSLRRLASAGRFTRRAANRPRIKD